MNARTSMAMTFLAVAFAACRKSAPPDPLCSYEPAPQTMRLESGQGAVQIVGATSEYFHVRDSTGKQVTSGSLNHAVGVAPGEYTVLLNNSPHTVFVEQGKLTKCGCGSIQVNGATDEYYHVHDGTGKQLASGSIGKASSVFPGAYTVKLNNTTAPAEVKAGAPTTLESGLLEVTGTTDEYYFVLDSAGTQLASSSLQRRTALFPGTWTVKINNTTTTATIKPRETSTLQTGTLMVRGGTGEYYYVLNEAGSQVASSSLDKATALFPGAYRVKVNNSTGSVNVMPGQATELATGTITAKKSGTDYYYVLDTNGSQLASAQVNKPSALLPGQYTVRIGENKKQASVSAGKDTTLPW